LTARKDLQTFSSSCPVERYSSSFNRTPDTLKREKPIRNIKFKTDHETREIIS